MKYRNVGKSGLKVSEIAMGSWMTDLQGSEKAAGSKPADGRKSATGMMKTI